jgi:hypothetical protein
MRRLVEPLPSMHCGLCNGELLLERIAAASPESDRDVAIYLCAKCGHEHSRLMPNEPYTTHTFRHALGSR